MNKIIKALLIVMVLTMAVMAFVGCEQEVDPCADGHTFEAFGEEPATCTTAGKSAGVVCKVCGYEERTRFEIPAKGHNMADATCTEPSTCTREGCGYTEGEALGHSLVDVAEVPATCTEVGYTAHKGCERCSYTEGKEEIALIPHSYTKDVEAKAPTCLPGYEAHKVCEVCGKADPETFVEIPSLGDEGHLFEEENYFVYQEPTCSEQGLLAGVCSYCEKAFLLSYIPTLPHEMVDGKCSVCGHEHAFEDGVCDCGEKDPTYVDYYLIGYINGADYGCNNDYENLGEYKFVDGKLTVTFTQDSYVFVKTGDLFGANKDWFMSSTYENDKDAILANTSTGTSEKLFIPGNVEVVLTLTINDDGTLTLVADYHVHVFSDATCTEAAKCECGETQGEALGHSYTDGICGACGAVDPNHYFVVTIPEALAAEDNKKVEVSGTVCAINTAWSDSYGNITVTITDANGNELYIYRLKTNVALGDIITVKGVMATYNSNRQIAAGATAQITGHDSSYDYAELSIADALLAADNTNVIVTGTVVKIGTPYSSQYGNISVYIADENGTQLYLYRLTGDVTVGQIIKVKGAMATYSGNRQLTGGTFEAVGTHTCTTFTDATCADPASCVVCGTAKDDILSTEHDYVDGRCTVCGGVDPEFEGEVAELATESLAIFANQGSLVDKVITWTGENFTFANAQASSTSAIRTSDADHHRVYAKSEVTISGSKITKVVITCTSESYAGVCANSLTTAGVTATVDGSVVTLTVDSGTLDSIVIGATAQWRLNNVEVTYEK